MKKFVFILCVMASVVCANAKILRVSNVNGSSAPYSTVKDALEAAEDGDVIMVDASPNSYGDVDINKKVTLQGPGYWLISNEIVQEGIQTAEFGSISITASGAKVSSVYVDDKIELKEDGCVITRCNVLRIRLDDGVKGAIIHQNYIRQTNLTICCSSYIIDIRPSNIQITNNIIRSGANSITDLSNSIIKYNTFTDKSYNTSFYKLKNCLFENNIADFDLMDSSGDNLFVNTLRFPDDFSYKPKDIDNGIRASDLTISTEHGAFAGEDPYVISGIAPGPYIEDIYVPVSVTKGDDMQVKVKIGVAR